MPGDLLDLGDGEAITMLYLLIKDLDLNHMYLLSFLPALLLGQDSQQETNLRKKEGFISAQPEGRCCQQLRLVLPPL